MRFVVVEIPDNAEADAFVSAIKNGAVWYGKPEGDEIKVLDTAYKGWKVPQVYAVPTMFCECPIQYPEGRSQRYGWYACTNCSKPRKGSMQHPFNLKEIHVPVKQRVYYMGFRADRRGWNLAPEPKAKS